MGKWFNETHAALLGQWLPHSDPELRSRPSLEFCLNDPESTHPEDLCTDADDVMAISC